MHLPSFLNVRHSPIRALPPQNVPETDWWGGLSDRTMDSQTSVEGGPPPARIPRFWPTRDRMGIWWSNAPHAMGVPFDSDQAYLPPPLVGTVKGATPMSVRYGTPASASSVTIPAIYVGQSQ